MKKAILTIALFSFAVFTFTACSSEVTNEAEEVESDTEVEAETVEQESAPEPEPAPEPEAKPAKADEAVGEIDTDKMLSEMEGLAEAVMSGVEDSGLDDEMDVDKMAAEATKLASGDND